MEKKSPEVLKVVCRVQLRKNAGVLATTGSLKNRPVISATGEIATKILLHRLPRQIRAFSNSEYMFITQPRVQRTALSSIVCNVFLHWLLFVPNVAENLCGHNVTTINGTEPTPVALEVRSDPCNSKLL